MPDSHLSVAGGVADPATEDAGNGICMRRQQPISDRPDFGKHAPVPHEIRYAHLHDSRLAGSEDLTRSPKVQVFFGDPEAVVGLAFQGTLANFAAGVMLLVFRPFKVGDFVEVNTETGTCEHIDLFTCEFRTLDNKKLIIPNSAVFGSTITNYTGYETRRVDIDVGAEYSADVDATRKALEGATANIPGMLEEPAPQVFLKALGGSSVDWQVRVWCKTADYWNVWQATTQACKASLDAAGIGIRIGVNSGSIRERENLQVGDDDRERQTGDLDQAIVEPVELFAQRTVELLERGGYAGKMVLVTGP